jgi:hypothetical protein
MLVNEFANLPHREGQIVLDVRGALLAEFGIKNCFYHGVGGKVGRIEREWKAQGVLVRHHE